jgi:hypothetical protein
MGTDLVVESAADFDLLGELDRVRDLQLLQVLVLEVRQKHSTTPFRRGRSRGFESWVWSGRGWAGVTFAACSVDPHC